MPQNGTNVNIKHARMPKAKSKETAVYRIARTDSDYKIKLNRARQLYNNISMLFLFPVKDGKLSKLDRHCNI